jgi:hypothetical protein
MKMSSKCVFASILIMTFLLGIVSTGQAMPNFARRYGMDCSVCHTAVPKLNRIGYEFRLAGYRMPADIGKDDSPAKLMDFFGARAQEQFIYKSHKDINPAKNTSLNSLDFFEFTMYPLSGAWGKYFGSLGEFSMAPDDVFEVENAFIRFAKGNEKGFLSARIGIMHPWEGVGSSDRPLGNGRPIFQKASSTGSPFFLWNLDESAGEVAYYFAKTGTTLTARVSNGILWKEDGSGTAEPAQGGGLVKPKDQPGANDKNFQIFLNQFYHGDSAISFYYYHGTNPFPDPHYAFTTTTTKDTFDRAAIYGNFWAMPEKLNLLAAYSFGKDSVDDPTVASSDGKYKGVNAGKDNGYMIEGDYHIKPEFAFGLRYDGFDPTDKVSHNSQRQVSLIANYRIYEGLQFIGDYVFKTIDQSAGGHNTDKQFLARLIFIF